MPEDTVVGLPRPGGTVEDDPLLGVLRDGARRMLRQAIETEVAEFLALHADRVDDHGRRRLVRNGHTPERTIQTGIGPIEVRRPRVRDRGAAGDALIRRLVATWQDEHRRWLRRDLSGKRYVYVWADGVYFAPRLEHDRHCLLVLIGADASGPKRAAWS